MADAAKDMGTDGGARAAGEPARPAVGDRGCTCFQVRRAARLVTHVYDATLAPAGVSIVQYAVLNGVARDGELTISSLADRLATDRTTLSRTVDRMRAAGLIDTAPGDDRRERRLSLTGRGRAVFAEARLLWQAAEARLSASLGPERLADLRALLGALEDVSDELARPADGPPCHQTSRRNGTPS